MKRRDKKPGVNARVEWFGREVADSVSEAMIAPTGPLVKAALAIERCAKFLLRIGGGKDRLPSDPGQPPHRQTNTLRNSITYASVPAKRSPSVIVGPTAMAPYGKTHEFGLRVGGVQYPERPFMTPAYDQAKTEFARFFHGLNLAQTPTGKRLNKRKSEKSGDGA
jgi:hypothetical protein